MHGIDVIANILMEKNKVNRIASGTSISGMIHIGNLTDLIIAEALNRSILEKEKKSSLVWIMDDIDPLRKVPPQLPKNYEKYIGTPVCDILWNKKENETFVEHSTKAFVSAMEEIGIKPIKISSAEMYKKGLYDESIKVALRKADEIRRIFYETSGAEKEEGWLPFTPICENCGKIATTRAFEFSGSKIRYRCLGGVAGKQRIDGCGYEGETSIRNGKLAWRVEWAARWKFLGITCEPFGKEHAASGGSYDTSKRISEEIYEYKAPYPVVYEHILVAGKKMSKSLGNIVTLRELLKILKPEVVRFFFFRVKATTHKDFEIEKEIIPLIKEYERVERLYYGMEHPSKGEDLDELKRIYELSQVEKPRKTLVQIPYAHLTTLFQISDDEDTITKNLEKSGHMRGTEEEIEEIREMIPLVRNFLNMPAAENLKFTIRRKLGKNEVRIGENEKECLEKIADMVDQVKDEDDLNSRIYFISKDLGLKPKDTFRMVYNLFLGKDHGPKAGTLLLSLDKDFVKKRLRLME